MLFEKEAGGGKYIRIVVHHQDARIIRQALLLFVSGQSEENCTLADMLWR